MKEQKFKFLKVTIEKLYIIPMLDEERTEINGWDIETVIKDWFEDRRLHQSHATRDSHEVGYSEKLLHTELIDFINAKDWLKNEKE